MASRCALSTAGTAECAGLLYPEPEGSAHLAENPQDPLAPELGDDDGTFHWPLARSLSPEKLPPPPRSALAYVAMLHGNQEMFFIYALHLGHQLQATGSCEPPDGEEAADRVLLLGPSRFSDKAHRAALSAAGWTHICSVDLIRAPHLTAARRHESVFTKLRMFELPYKRLLFLDLDLHVQKDLRELFSLPAPAGKCYFRRIVRSQDLKHGQELSKTLPAEALDAGIWCPNAGVLRVDPETTLAMRRQQVKRMETEILNFVDDDPKTWSNMRPTMLPEQDYLAQRIDGWRHIGRMYNLEIIEANSAEELSKASVVHFSSKRFCTQPTAWLDQVTHDNVVVVEWCREFLEGFCPEIYAYACRLWRNAFEELCCASKAWCYTARAVFDQAVEKLKSDAPQEREWCEQDVRWVAERDRWRGSCWECYSDGCDLFEGRGRWQGRRYCEKCWNQWLNRRETGSRQSFSE